MCQHEALIDIFCKNYNGRVRKYGIISNEIMYNNYWTMQSESLVIWFIKLNSVQKWKVCSEKE